DLAGLWAAPAPPRPQPECKAPGCGRWSLRADGMRERFEVRGVGGGAPPPTIVRDAVRLVLVPAADLAVPALHPPGALAGRQLAVERRGLHLRHHVLRPRRQPLERDVAAGGQPVGALGGEELGFDAADPVD